MKKAFLLLVLFSAAGFCHAASPVRDLQHELGIDDKDWKVDQETATQIFWITKDKVSVALMINKGHGEIRNPDDETGMQNTFRDEAKELKGGLVEVKMLDTGGVKGAVVTMKFKSSTFDPKVDGFAYQMNAIIPTISQTYVIQAGAAEESPTGVRESVVMVVDMKDRGITDISEAAKRFRRDPYDEKYNTDALYAISDDRKWDQAAPAHPLTRVRKVMDALVKTLKISDRIKKEAVFQNKD